VFHCHAQLGLFGCNDFFNLFALGDVVQHTQEYELFINHRFRDRMFNRELFAICTEHDGMGV